MSSKTFNYIKNCCKNNCFVKLIEGQEIAFDVFNKLPKNQEDGCNSQKIIQEHKVTPKKSITNLWDYHAKITGDRENVCHKFLLSHYIMWEQSKFESNKKKYKHVAKYMTTDGYILTGPIKFKFSFWELASKHIF